MDIAKVFVSVALTAACIAGPSWSVAAQPIVLAQADAAPPCENGEPRDEGGACPQVDDGSAATRGFTLFSGGARPQAAPAARTAAPAAAVPARPAAPALAGGGDLAACASACDLRVAFATGSSEVPADAAARLTRFADALRSGPLSRKRFEIGGHTDGAGAGEQNRQISLARAEAVKRFLVAHGVDAARLEVKGYGSEGLAVPSQPRDPRNRRIEARALN